MAGDTICRMASMTMPIVAASAMGPVNRELAPRLKAAVAASAELQEHDALKSVSLADELRAASASLG
jgi:hypothetical protein